MGTTVPASWFLDRAVTTILTNGVNEIFVRRDGGTTNVTVPTAATPLGDGGCITLVALTSPEPLRSPMPALVVVLLWTT